VEEAEPRRVVPRVVKFRRHHHLVEEGALEEGHEQTYLREPHGEPRSQPSRFSGIVLKIEVPGFLSERQSMN
jgi:hypothetical protein